MGGNTIESVHCTVHSAHTYLITILIKSRQFGVETISDGESTTLPMAAESAAVCKLNKPFFIIHFPWDAIVFLRFT